MASKIFFPGGIIIETVCINFGRCILGIKSKFQYSSRVNICLTEALQTGNIIVW